jgi:hypothetical protein
MPLMSVALAVFHRETSEQKELQPENMPLMSVALAVFHRETSEQKELQP